jgi:hypothetical protein
MIACPAKNQWVTAMARYIVAIVLLAIIAGPALAQHKKGPDNPMVEEYARKKKDAEAIEKEYSAARKNIDQTATPTRVDPWQNMRGADDSKTKR